MTLNHKTYAWNLAQLRSSHLFRERLTKPSVAQSRSEMTGRLMGNGLDRTRKVEVVASCEVLLKHLSGEIEGIHESPHQGQPVSGLRSPGTGLSMGPLRHEAGLPTTTRLL
jgi:hypothetical protein